MGGPAPPGNPRVEPDLYRLVPGGVPTPSARLDSAASASAPGAPAGMEDRTRAYVESLPGPAGTLAAVNPAGVGLAFTGGGYAHGVTGGQTPLDRLPSRPGPPAPPAAPAIP